MFTILPSTVWIRVAHPTEQNGQMLGVVLASLIRSSCARAVAGASVTPSPTSPPIAVPAPPLAVRRRKSRRLTCIDSSALESNGEVGARSCVADSGGYRDIVPRAHPMLRHAAAGVPAGLAGSL